MTDTKKSDPINVPNQRDFAPSETFVVEDLDTLKVLADPLRLKILELMESPCTVKQVAASLDLPPTKLYYHINQLEKHGLIVVVETRIVSGIIEKHYQVAAYRIEVAEHLLSPGEGADPEGLTITVDSVLEDIRVSLHESLQSGIASTSENAEQGKRNVNMYSGRFYLTPEQIEAFNESITAIIEEYEKISEQQTEGDFASPYKVLYTTFPAFQRRSKSDD